MNGAERDLDIDTSVAHAARVYDFLLGGVDNFEVDRQIAVAVNADMPGGLDRAQANARANREFLGRAVRYLVGEAGVRQFLDIGTGVPNADNVHAIAQVAAPESRVVCVDNDPIVLAHAHTLMASTPEGGAAFVHGDLRDPEDILAAAASTVKFDEPVAVMLVAILHFFTDADDPYGIVGRLMDDMCTGSFLVVSHGAADIDAENMAVLTKRLTEASRETFVWRSHSDVAQFFDGLHLIAPGGGPGGRVAPRRPNSERCGLDHPVLRRHWVQAMTARHLLPAALRSQDASLVRAVRSPAVYVAHEAHELALADTAFATGAGALTPLVETTLGTRLARAHAGVGNTTQCLRSLEQARTAFANAGSDEEPLWASYVDEIEVYAQEGACYLDLSLTGEATASLRHAVELLQRHAPHRVRDRVHYLSRLAKCHLAEREVEQACIA